MCKVSNGRFSARKGNKFVFSLVLLKSNSDFCSLVSQLCALFLKLVNWVCIIFLSSYIYRLCVCQRICLCMHPLKIQLARKFLEPLLHSMVSSTHEIMHKNRQALYMSYHLMLDKKMLIYTSWCNKFKLSGTALFMLLLNS